MRPTTNFALHSALAASLIAFAATSAAGAIYMKYGTIKGEVAVKDGKVGDGWIEIGSYQWGHVAKIDAFPVKQGVVPHAELYGTGQLAERSYSSGNPDGTSPKLARPAARGSMTLKMPASQCVVGTHHPTATLDTGTMRYEMENVMVSSCSGSGSGGGASLPSEEISFNYDKISTAYPKQDDKQQPKSKIRGWDPDKKEQ